MSYKRFNVLLQSQRFVLVPYVFGFLFLTLSLQAQDNTVRFTGNPEGTRIDVAMGNAPFTSFWYATDHPLLKKPILFPVYTASGIRITRGYPLDPQPYERADHPHQVGVWLNHGDVNNIDFWNNSDAIPPEEQSHYGRIVVDNVDTMRVATGTAQLSYQARWLDAKDHPLLLERTTFSFSMASGARIIDRTTTLQALHDTVRFEDSKEGMMAIRVIHELEHTSIMADRYLDAQGKLLPAPKVDNEGVTGHYISSEGIEGYDVWGTRARWVRLQGRVAGQPVTVALLDHPDNEGYPSYWMARGYGLFAANPLGDHIFDSRQPPRNFTLPPQSSTTFRYRLVVMDAHDSSGETIEHLFQAFINAPSDAIH